MTDKTNHDIQETLAKLEAFLDGQTKSPPDFTEEDITILKRVIVLVVGLEALGSFAGFVKSSIIWFGVLIGAIIAIRNGAIEFIIQAVNSK